MLLVESLRVEREQKMLQIFFATPAEHTHTHFASGIVVHWSIEILRSSCGGPTLELHSCNACFHRDRWRGRERKTNWNGDRINYVHKPHLYRKARQAESKPCHASRSHTFADDGWSVRMNVCRSMNRINSEPKVKLLNGFDWKKKIKWRLCLSLSRSDAMTMEFHIWIINIAKDLFYRFVAHSGTYSDTDECVGTSCWLMITVVARACVWWGQLPTSSSFVVIESNRRMYRSFYRVTDCVCRHFKWKKYFFLSLISILPSSHIYTMQSLTFSSAVRFDKNYLWHLANETCR